MSLRSLFCVSLALLFNSTSCRLPLGYAEAGVPSPAKSPQVSLRRVPAAMGDDPKGLTGLSERKVNDAEELNSVQFLDADNGWVADKTSLYRTPDGGRRWERLPVGLPRDSYISSFFFVSRAKGWLVRVTRSDVGRYGLGQSSKVLTTDDGGSTWDSQGSFKNEVSVRRIKFLNANEGFAIGTAVVDGRPPHVEVFAASTKDGGKTWDDISEAINAVIKNGGSAANDYAADVSVPSPSQVVLLTGLGRVVSSQDGGKSWKVVTQIQGGRSQTGYEKIGLGSRGEVKIIGGETGDEGSGAGLVTSDGTGSWVSYDLPRASISDAVFLSDEEIIACGSEVLSAPHEDGAQGERPLAGIILYSRDGGRTWSIPYRSSSNQTLASISRVGDDNFYVVGDEGAFLKFTLAK